MEFRKINNAINMKTTHSFVGGFNMIVEDGKDQLWILEFIKNVSKKQRSELNKYFSFYIDVDEYSFDFIASNKDYIWDITEIEFYPSGVIKENQKN